MCTEEGWEEDTGLVNGALKNVYLERTSPLLLVQRDGDQLRGTWLGAPLRGWLDLPLSMQERDAYRDGGGPALMPDGLAAPLVGRERELHEQVLVDPYDRGVRDVLRDLWIERGDPRGDYCTASDPATVDHDRAATLIADHARSWVGALQPVIPLAGALFGYGPWIRSAIVYADRAALDAVADAPEWGSIERIEFAMGSARLVSPRMRNARAIGPLTLDELAPLRTGDWQVRELDVEIADHPLDLATLALPLTVLRLRPPAHARPAVDRAALRPEGRVVVARARTARAVAARWGKRTGGGRAPRVPRRGASRRRQDADRRGARRRSADGLDARGARRHALGRGQQARSADRAGYRARTCCGWQGARPARARRGLADVRARRAVAPADLTR
jgi:hypothetical protein